MADVVIDHRRPTIKVARSIETEYGARIALYWNGQKFANGDGYAIEDAEIDYTWRIAGPARLWPRGEDGFGTGGFALGGFGESADSDPASGFGAGGFGLGGFGLSGSFFTWRPTFDLRNGVYRFAARLIDEVGNEQATDIGEVEVEVLAAPRPVSKAWLESYSEPNLTIAWRPSRDFQPEVS